MPTSLWCGRYGLVLPALIKLERDAYFKLTSSGESAIAHINLVGGAAWSQALKDTHLIKFQPHRIIMSRHSDLTIRFQDLDARLLLGPKEGPLQNPFPSPLHHLNIDVASLLAEPAIATHVPPSLLMDARIRFVELARESLDCAVALETGQIIVYKLPSLLDQDQASSLEEANPELLNLKNSVLSETGNFRPTLLLSALCGSVSALAISDLGLVAVAYEDTSLYIIDSKGPSLIFKDISSERKEHRTIFHKSTEADPFRSLSWTICGIKKDSFPRIRLLAIQKSGNACIYTIEHNNSTGHYKFVDTSAAEGQPLPLTDPDSSFVISADTGLRCRADGHSLHTALDSDTSLTSTQKHSVWITAGVRGARAILDVNGDRVGKTEWPNKAGTVLQVRLIERTDSCSLVAFTDSCQALVYSLPELNFLHKIDLPYTHKSAPLITADTTGDYLLSTVHPGTQIVSHSVYGTLFAQRRSYVVPPRLELGFGRGEVPPQPQPVPIGPVSLFGSLMGYVGAAGSVSKEQADVLLFGRPRPILQTPSIENPRQSRQSDAGSATAASSGYNMPDVGSVGAQIGQSASTWGTNIGQGATAVFGKLNDALAERGEMLDSLQQSMRSLEQGTQNAMNQAKLAAAKQTAKGWFSGF